MVLYFNAHSKVLTHTLSIFTVLFNDWGEPIIFIYPPRLILLLLYLVAHSFPPGGPFKADLFYRHELPPKISRNIPHAHSLRNSPCLNLLDSTFVFPPTLQNIKEKIPSFQSLYVGNWR